MDDLHAVAARQQIVGQALADGHRAVPAAGAADADRQATLALGLEGRDREIEEVLDLLEELGRGRLLEDVLADGLGQARELAQRFDAPPKGEITLVLGPAAESAENGEAEERALAAVAELVEAGVPRKRAAEVVSKLAGISRNRLYKASL